MERKIKPFLALAAIICVFISACEQKVQNASVKNLGMEKSEPQVMTTIEGKITDDRNSWTSRTQKFKIGTDNFTAIQPVNSNKALLSTPRGLLSVNIEGRTIKQERLDLPEGLNGDIASIFFSNASLGSVVVRKTPSDVLDDQGFASFVLKTQNGGLSWRAQYDGTAQELERLVFLNDREGWAAGGAVVKSQTLEHRLLALHTTDGGEHWLDVSTGLNTLGQGRIKDVYVDSSQVLMVTSDRSVMGTKDGGQTWNRLGHIEDEPPQVALYKIGSLRNGRPWVLGGTGGREGTWSILAVKTDKTNWVKQKTYDVLLKDAVFLSDEEVIACGVIPSNKNVPLPDDAHRAGVILRSLDRGRNWTVIYRDPKAKSLDAIAPGRGGYVWAVGEAGLIIRLGPVS